MADQDTRRVAGWLPEKQDDLEAWLAGHAERVAAKGEQAPLHPVIAEFQELIDSDPVVRMYLNEMVAQVPRGRAYTKRHLQSVPQLLRLINEVLTMAPEYSEDAMVVLPLGAILDWTMGSPTPKVPTRSSPGTPSPTWRTSRRGRSSSSKPTTRSSARSPSSRWG